MEKIEISHARKELPGLLRRVEAGEEVLIVRGGQAIVRIVPVPACDAAPPRRFGCDAHRFTLPEDFDAPMELRFVDRQVDPQDSADGPPG